MQAELLRIGAGGVVPVRWELAKAEEDPGTITGWASVYNVIDQQDDVAIPGVFTKSLADWRRTGRVIPLTKDHQNDSEGVIGSLFNAQDTRIGFKPTFKFASTDDAQRARTKAREGHLNGLSIFGEIKQKSMETFGDREVRVLKEVALLAVGLTPFPANTGSLVTATKAVVDAAWDGSSSRFTPEQWRRSCLIDTGQGDVSAKSRYKLPVREPNGDINRSAVHAAAGGHGVGAVTGISDELRRAAARKLVSLYRNDLKEDPPAGLLTAAGMASASLVLPDAWVSDMRAALAISVPTARKAAVDVLVAEQYQLGAVDLDADDAGGDAPGDEGEAEAEAEDAAQYALNLIGDTPPEPSVDDLLAGIDNVSTAHLTSDLDALAAELASR